MRNSSEIKYVRFAWPSFFILFSFLPFVLFPFNIIILFDEFFAWEIFYIFCVFVCRCRCVSLCECDGKCYMMYHHRLVCGKANKMAKFYGKRDTKHWTKAKSLKVLSFLSFGIDEKPETCKRKRIDKRTNELTKTIKVKFIYRARSCLLWHKMLFEKCWFCSKFRRKFNYSKNCTIDWDIPFYQLVWMPLFCY